MGETAKLPEPQEITEEMKLKCTCETYAWNVHPCPYYEGDPENLHAKCNCCPHCLEICAKTPRKE